MTNNAAIDVLRHYVSNSEHDAATNIAIAALEKQTPKPLRITTSTKRCPSCNKQISGKGNIHANYRYCRWCGQAIDWRGDDGD